MYCGCSNSTDISFLLFIRTRTFGVQWAEVTLEWRSKKRKAEKQMDGRRRRTIRTPSDGRSNALMSKHGRSFKSTVLSCKIPVQYYLPFRCIIIRELYIFVRRVSLNFLWSSLSSLQLCRP